LVNIYYLGQASLAGGSLFPLKTLLSVAKPFGNTYLMVKIRVIEKDGHKTLDLMGN